MHAYLTGHTGTPTPLGAGLYDQATPTPSDPSDLGDFHSPTSTSAIAPEPLDIFTPKVLRVGARLLSIPGDVQVSPRLQSLSRATMTQTRRVLSSASQTQASSASMGPALNADGPIEIGDAAALESGCSVEANAVAFSASYNTISVHGSFDPYEDMWSDISDISPFVGEAFAPVTVPLEHLHARPVRSPYLLRQNRYPTTNRIRQQVRATGQPLDILYLREAGIKKFKPSKKVVETNLDMLFKCTTFMGFGISLSEFGKIIYSCIKCDRHVFIDSLAKHDCEGDVEDVYAPSFSIMSAIHRHKCAGLTARDIEHVFHVCDTCRRVYMFRYHTLHDCTDLGLAVVSTARRGQVDDDDYTEHL